MENTKTGCGQSEFNYCKWAKLLVAIPALPLIGVMGASLFDHPFAQIIGAAGCVTITVLAALWIDSIPLLQKKFRNSGKCD